MENTLLDRGSCLVTRSSFAPDSALGRCSLFAMRRGDMVVFLHRTRTMREPWEADHGRAGDRIHLRNGVVRNGEALNELYLAAIRISAGFLPQQFPAVHLVREWGISQLDRGSGSAFREHLVGLRHYSDGDPAGFSLDSRYWGFFAGNM